MAGGVPPAGPNGEWSPNGEWLPFSYVQDSHKYYKLSVYQDNVGNTFDDNFIEMQHADVKQGLSDTKLGAEHVKPAFPFPFYGHDVSEFYVTTHGFLSLAPRLHDYIYKTQYIAPLRIKLDPSRSNDSTISVLSMPDRLTVEWSNVTVMEEAEHPSGGAFTFQVTLRPNGDIVFVYVEVQPVLTTAALYDHEPVAGISDAFLLHGSELHLYNKINIANPDINTRTVAIFQALPTCVSQTSCGACTDLSRSSNFTCFWCEAAGHCSDGADRKRQLWNDHRCHVANVTTCRGGSGAAGRSSVSLSSSSTESIVSAVISSLMVLVLVGMGGVFLYLYTKYNPDSDISRTVSRLKKSYHQFGAATGKITSLELGKKRSEVVNNKKPSHEFTNPHPMSTNNNVITANM